MIQPAVDPIQLRQGDERQKEDMGWGGFRGHEGTVSENFGGCSLCSPYNWNDIDNIYIAYQ